MPSRHRRSPPLPRLILALACLCQALMPPLHAQTMAASGNAGVASWLCGDGAAADSLRAQWRAQLPDAVAEALFAGSDADGADAMHGVSCPACISLCGQSLATGDSVSINRLAMQLAPTHRAARHASALPRLTLPPLPARGPPARS